MGSVFIQSVDRAFKILEYISAKNSAGISEISRDLDINKSTVFGLIKTLESLGYIVKSKRDSKYLLSYKFYSLSSRSAHSMPILDVIKPYLEKLSKKYGETVHLVVGTDNSVVYIDKLDGTQSISVFTKIGAKMPLHCTGVGKAILSLRDNIQVMEYADFFGLETFTKNTITNKFKLIEEIEKIRKQGYSLDDEEAQYDLFCIAIAFKTEKEEYSISISVPKFRINEKLKKSIIEDLLEIKDSMSKYYL
ncbi:IclR family transcriptional regulator [Miniphocaeibacter massiliensis]|uniref:IclR family transcriptional regulator n=1 Tax=Miniphocaeibacter massiliensis TaxID=2041841 RepID=UPI000C06B759|nr:IclR family transcriptional regulator [Miniphocaeibacter massiliensis]